VRKMLAQDVRGNQPLIAPKKIRTLTRVVQTVNGKNTEMIGTASYFRAPKVPATKHPQLRSTRLKDGAMVTCASGCQYFDALAVEPGASAGQIVKAIQITPYTMGDRLKELVLAGYTKWAFKSLSIHRVTASPTSQAGSLITCFYVDVADSAPWSNTSGFVRNAYDTDNHSVTSIWEDQSSRIDFDINGLEDLIQTVPSPDDDNSQGLFVTAIDTAPGFMSNTSIGDLFIEYELYLFNEAPLSNSASQSIAFPNVLISKTAFAATTGASVFFGSADIAFPQLLTAHPDTIYLMTALPTGSAGSWPLMSDGTNLNRTIVAGECFYGGCNAAGTNMILYPTLERAVAGGAGGLGGAYTYAQTTTYTAAIAFDFETVWDPTTAPITFLAELRRRALGERGSKVPRPTGGQIRKAISVAFPSYLLSPEDPDDPDDPDGNDPARAALLPKWMTKMSTNRESYPPQPGPRRQP